MAADLTLNVNGNERKVSSDPARTLLDVLREDLQLTGTKYGCGEGECRACTVLLDGRAVRSCLTRIGSLERGAKIETIESLFHVDGKLHAVQQAFLDEGAMQCGYCVPGMIMSTVGLLRGNPKPSREQIIEGLNGNLCRCCGYVNIIKAVERAAQAPA